MSKIEFSLSPSSVNLFMESELLFFYSYILKAEEDTNVPKAYGLGGNAVHLAAEKYINEKGNIIQYFTEYWNKFNLSTMPAMFGKTLKKSQYLQAAIKSGNIVDSLQNFYERVRSEEKIKNILYEDDVFKIHLGGIIDVIAEKKDETIIVDFKTSSSVDGGNGFKRQGLHYCLLYYITYGFVPSKVVFEYVKIGKEVQYSFSLDEVLEYKKFIEQLSQKIIEKGTNIDNYEIGDVSSIFNSHAKKCSAEIERRKTPVEKEKEREKFVIEITHGVLYFPVLTAHLEGLLNKKYVYDVEGARFSELYKKRIWDGKKRFLKNSTLPLGFFHDIIQFLEDYKKHFSKDFEIVVKDGRQKVDGKFDVNPSELPFDLRYYQKEAAITALEKKLGILWVGTGGGKSAIAAEIFRKLKTRSLFIVNRVELAKQTQEAFKTYLDIDVGLMIEGTEDCDKMITVASIQTIYAILQRSRKDFVFQNTLKFLYNVHCVIFDECHGLQESKMYKTLSDVLPNTEYRLGLSGTPWRGKEGSKDTLEMNSFVGFPIYKKTVVELTREGWLTPCKCYFLNYSPFIQTTLDFSEKRKEIELKGELTWQDDYLCKIVYNEPRTQLLLDTCKLFNSKKILILVNRVRHGELLNSFLPSAERITGSTTKEERKRIFKEFSKKESGIIIGSSQIMSTGIDIPALDCILSAQANKSDKTTLQSIGRVLRRAANKKLGLFIDFNDTDRMFLSTTSARADILREHEYEVEFCDFETFAEKTRDF